MHVYWWLICWNVYHFWYLWNRVEYIHYKLECCFSEKLIFLNLCSIKVVASMRFLGRWAFKMPFKDESRWNWYRYLSWALPLDISLLMNHNSSVCQMAWVSDKNRVTRNCQSCLAAPMTTQPFKRWLHSGNGPGLKMHFLLKMVIFHCYVSSTDGETTAVFADQVPAAFSCAALTLAPPTNSSKGTCRRQDLGYIHRWMVQVLDSWLAW